MPGGKGTEIKVQAEKGRREADRGNRRLRLGVRWEEMAGLGARLGLFKDEKRALSEREALGAAAGGSEGPPAEGREQAGGGLLGRLKRNAGGMGLAVVVGYGMILLPQIVAARKVGASGFGRLSVAEAVMLYAMLAADMGLSLTGVREIAKARTSGAKAKLSETLWGFVGLKAGLAAGAIALLLPVTWFFPGEWKAIYGWTFLALLPETLEPRWVLQGLEKMSLIAPVMALRGLLWLGGLALWVHGPGDLVQVVQARVAAGALSTTAAYLLIAALVRPRWRLKAEQAKEWLASGMRIGASNILNKYTQSLGTIASKVVAGDAAAGMVSVALKCLPILNSFRFILVSAFFPVIASLWHEGKVEATRRVVAKATRLASSVGFLVCVVMAVVAIPAVKLVFGKGYVEAGVVLAAMSPAVFFFLTNLLYPNLLNAIKEEGRYLKGAVVLALVASAAYPAALQLGAVGAALAMGVVELTSLLFYHQQVKAALGEGSLPYKAFAARAVALVGVVVVVVNFFGPQASS